MAIIPLPFRWEWTTERSSSTYGHVYVVSLLACLAREQLSSARRVHVNSPCPTTDSRATTKAARGESSPYTLLLMLTECNIPSWLSVALSLSVSANPVWIPSSFHKENLHYTIVDRERERDSLVSNQQTYRTKCNCTGNMFKSCFDVLHCSPLIIKIKINSDFSSTAHTCFKTKLQLEISYQLYTYIMQVKRIV